MLDTYLDVAIRAARIGGAVLVEYFDRVHTSRTKNENLRDLVTEVDLLSEKGIKQIIRESFPEHSIVAEESGVESRDTSRVWHIDPLDGTVNYSQGIPFCAVSVGMEENGVLKAGAVYNPFADELFYAARGKGAFLNGRPMQVSGKKNFRDGLYVGAFSSVASSSKAAEYAAFGAVNDGSRGALRLGSAAVALAYVASGRIDGFWAKDLYSWDLAGGVLLIEEAGGRAGGAGDTPFDFGQSLQVASNGLVHAELARLLEAHGVR